MTSAKRPLPHVTTRDNLACEIWPQLLELWFTLLYQRGKGRNCSACQRLLKAMDVELLRHDMAEGEFYMNSTWYHRMVELREKNEADEEVMVEDMEIALNGMVKLREEVQGQGLKGETGDAGGVRRALHPDTIVISGMVLVFAVLMAVLATILGM